MRYFYMSMIFVSVCWLSGCGSSGASDTKPTAEEIKSFSGDPSKMSAEDRAKMQAAIEASKQPAPANASR